MSMTSFLQFLNEANAIGSKFEQAAANAVQNWIVKNGLQKKWKAKRFQTIAEDNGTRAEDYSDVVVENLVSGEQFFIECKQNCADNIITTMFDFKEVVNNKNKQNRTFCLVPVEGKSRNRIQADAEDPRNELAHKLVNNEDFQEFNDFIIRPCKLLNNICPADFLLGKEDVPRQLLDKLIKTYNKLVDAGKTNADCKKFDNTLIRASTKNMLAVALAWRSIDSKHTWDICKMESFNIGDLIRNHYIKEKAIPVKYMQLGKDKTYVLQAEDNPFELDCQVFPKEVIGNFWLKFTPRFGTGSMYITPRSKIIGELPETTSFMDKEKLPKTL